jgi:hypothetical protein
MEEEHLEDDDNDFLEWMIFGKTNEENTNMAFIDADWEDPCNSAINDVAAEDQCGTIEGLHWDTSFKIHEALGIEVNQQDEGKKRNVWEETTSPLIRVNE